jgi:hypothetical protein
VESKRLTIEEAIASGKRLVLLPQQADGPSSGSTDATEPYRDPTVPVEPGADRGHEW